MNVNYINKSIVHLTNARAHHTTLMKEHKQLAADATAEIKRLEQELADYAVTNDA